MGLITEAEIAQLLAERKHLPRNWRKQLKTKRKSNLSHEEREFLLEGEHGNRFTLWIRKSINDKSDFTVGLRWIDSSGHQHRLKRYNGPGHSHINHYEKRRKLPNPGFDGLPHIHIATERYQKEGLSIDGYAEVSTSFVDLSSAIKCMIADNRLVIPRKRKDCIGQQLLFEVN